MIVYVPTLGADESDIPRAMRLFDSPAKHYWEDTGVIGKYFQQRLGLDVYAWDIWMIYPPGPRWDETLPPQPAFWMHQLGGIEDHPRLDVTEFAARVGKLLDRYDTGGGQ